MNGYQQIRELKTSKEYLTKFSLYKFGPWSWMETHDKEVVSSNP